MFVPYFGLFNIHSHTPEAESGNMALSLQNCLHTRKMPRIFKSLRLVADRLIISIASHDKLNLRWLHVSFD